MNAIKNILNLEYKNKSLNYLGKWKIDYKYNIINKKIDLANMDNCGCCDMDNNTKINNNYNNDEYIKYFLISL